MKEDHKGCPSDLKGSGEDRPHKRQRRRPQQQMSDFEQLRRDTLGAQDRASYIQGDSMRQKGVSM